MIVDVSGFSYSGKSAFYDLLAKSDGLKGFGVEFEFDLFRVQGGVLDLYQALCVTWSPVRSSEAIRRFARLVHYLGGKRTLYDRLVRHGSHYDLFIPDFTEKSYRFIDDLVLAKWNGEWPFSAFNESHAVSILKKNLRRLGIGDAEEIYLSSFSSDAFKLISRRYIKGLFECFDKGYCGVLTNNCFEPFDPLCSMEFVSDARSIVVDRDPRDIYLSATINRIVNGVDVGGAVVGGDVESFIKRFLVYRSNVSGSESPRLLRTSFENLIFNFDSELERLKRLLSPLPLDWGLIAKSFDKLSSKRNVRQWLKPESSVYINDIKKIELKLSEYCHF
jgi:hypothetical protein